MPTWDTQGPRAHLSQQRERISQLAQTLPQSRDTDVPTTTYEIQVELGWRVAGLQGVVAWIAGWVVARTNQTLVPDGLGA